jgi:hypothetical protein
MNRICKPDDLAGMMRGMRRASSEATWAKWRRIIGEHRDSGLTIAAFCRRERVPASSFFAWKRRLAEEPDRRAPAFVEVTAAPAAPDVPLELMLGGDRRLLIRRGFDAEVLREVVRAVEGMA